MSNPKFICMKFVLLLILFSLVKAQNSNCTNATAVYTFGDSIVDSGNNNYFQNVSFTIARANHTPYGVDYDNQIPTGRFSNALVLPDFVANYCGIARALPFLNPQADGTNLKQGVNFASGGATIIDNLSNLTPFNFTKQIEWFANVTQRLQALEGSTAASSRIANALYILSFGSNDFTQKSLTWPYMMMTDASFRTLLVDTYERRIRDLYNLGARKFIVSALGPLGCTPIAITLNCISFIFPQPPCNRSVCNENSNNLAYAFNLELQNKLNNLTSALSGSKFYFDFNPYNVTRDAISNPSKYGYTVVDRGCCGTGTVEIGDGCNGSSICNDRTKYIFFDAIHPGEVLIRKLAELLRPSLAT